MATKLVRTCDRKGCEIESVDSIENMDELQTSPKVGYTILKFETNSDGETVHEILVDLDEVCGDCATEVEALVETIRGHSEVAEEAKTEAVEPPKPKKRRGRPAGSKNKTKTEEEKTDLREGVKAALQQNALEKALDKAESSTTEEAPAETAAKPAAKPAAKTEEAPAEAAPAEPDPNPVDPVDTYVTEAGDVVDAETGEVIAAKTSDASPEDAPEDTKEPGVVAPSNGGEAPAHPF
jgi:hypothetical protein